MTPARTSDVEADRRDAEAGGRLTSASSAEQVREVCEAVLKDAARDRKRASADRHAAAGDRYDAARDRAFATSDRTSSAADLRHASLDPLTGAHNRAAGFTELARDIDRARRLDEPLTLAFLDVDGLKSINDQHGHAAGDRVLVQVVTALRSHLRAHDLVIRFGGDEFVCSFAGMADEEAHHRFARVNEDLAAATDPASITVGLAALRPDESADDLCRRADAAFYEARKRR